MSHYWARFEEISKNIYRYDTRIYINQIDFISSDDFCIGAIVGKNPGSAKGETSSDLRPISLDGDKLLPTVRNIMHKSFDFAKISIPKGAYIQVLNLFYLCEPNLDLAKSEAKTKVINGICDTEKKDFNFVWFAWGGNDNFLNSYKNRFFSIQTEQPFYYDYKNNIIQTQIPDEFASVKHTQGLKHDFVIPHIVELLKNNKSLERNI